jgi:hypothetical protein
MMYTWIRKGETDGPKLGGTVIALFASLRVPNIPIVLLFCLIVRPTIYKFAIWAKGSSAGLKLAFDSEIFQTSSDLVSLTNYCCS